MDDAKSGDMADDTDEKTLQIDLTEQDGDWSSEDRRERSTLDDLPDTESELAKLREVADEVKCDVRQRRG